MAIRYLIDFDITDIEEIYHEKIADITRLRPRLDKFDTDLGYPYIMADA